jgi:hypothetical protein
MNIRPKLPQDFPKIVCLCGSTRFSDAFKEATLRETIAGNIVLSVGCDTKSDKDLLILGEVTQEAKDKLDELHKRKIDLADEILVLNVGGYVGMSTSNEIDYAIAYGKEVRWLEPNNSRSLTKEMLHFAVICDSEYEFNCFVEKNNVTNPIYIHKSGKTQYDIGCNIIGFVILGDHMISQDLYNRINRRIRSKFVIVDENQPECK